MKIIKKAFMNKRTKQFSVTIPKKLLPVKLRNSPDLFFEIKAVRRKNG